VVLAEQTAELVDDLVPYLDRFGPRSRWCFRRFRRPGPPPYSQARLLRERFQYPRRAPRPPGQVLRDHFVFMLRAPAFDAFEVKKQSGPPKAFCPGPSSATSVFLISRPGDGRLTALHRRMQLRHSESAGL